MLFFPFMIKTKYLKAKMNKISDFKIKKNVTTNKS